MDKKYQGKKTIEMNQFKQYTERQPYQRDIVKDLILTIKRVMKLLIDLIFLVPEKVLSYLYNSQNRQSDRNYHSNSQRGSWRGKRGFKWPNRNLPDRKFERDSKQNKANKSTKKIREDKQTVLEGSIILTEKIQITEILRKEPYWLDLGQTLYAPMNCSVSCVIEKTEDKNVITVQQESIERMKKTTEKLNTSISMSMVIVTDKRTGLRGYSMETRTIKYQEGAEFQIVKLTYPVEDLFTPLMLIRDKEGEGKEKNKERKNYYAQYILSNKKDGRENDIHAWIFGLDEKFDLQDLDLGIFTIITEILSGQQQENEES